MRAAAKDSPLVQASGTRKNYRVDRRNTQEQNTHGSPQLRLCLVSRSLLVNCEWHFYGMPCMSGKNMRRGRTAHVAFVQLVAGVCGTQPVNTSVCILGMNDSRVRKCRLKCVVRVNFAGHMGHDFVCGTVGMLPLCRRMRDAVPSFFNSTGVAGALLSARGVLPEGEVVSATSVDMAMRVPVDVVLGGVTVAPVGIGPLYDADRLSSRRRRDGTRGCNSARPLLWTLRRHRTSAATAPLTHNVTRSQILSARR